MPVRARFVLLPLLALLSPTDLSAWWDGGHKLSAQIAYEELSPEERTWVMELLTRNPTHPELFEERIAAELGEGIDPEARERWYFSQASVWADLIRESRGYPRAKEINALYHRSGRHYADLPVFATPEDRRALAHQDEEPDIAWTPGMEEPDVPLNSLQTLAKAYAEIPDPTIPVEERAIDLLWIFHLVGDMHQPCHCAQLFVRGSLPEGDRGANQIFIFGIQSFGHGLHADTLHYFWDNVFNGPTNTEADILARLAALRQKTALWDAARGDAADIRPETWWRDGHRLAEAHVYGPIREKLASAPAQPHPAGGARPPIVQITLPAAPLRAYVDNAREVSERQIILAGLRLAGVLKELRQRELAARP